MAINGRFRVSMGDVFPTGAFVVGDVEPVRGFGKFRPERFVAHSLRARARPAPVTEVKVVGKPAGADGKAAA